MSDTRVTLTYMQIGRERLKAAHHSSSLTCSMRAGLLHPVSQCRDPGGRQMLRVRYSLSACHAGGSEIVADGVETGADLGVIASSVLEEHRDEISTVGGLLDLDGETIPWCIEMWDSSPLGGVLILGDAKAVRVPVSCWTTCPDHPNVNTPDVQLVLHLATATPPPPLRARSRWRSLPEQVRPRNSAASGTGETIRRMLRSGGVGSRSNPAA